MPAPEDNAVNLFRQMLQAQDEQIRAQQGQISQLTEMVKTLAVASATAANVQQPLARVEPYPRAKRILQDWALSVWMRTGL